MGRFDGLRRFAAAWLCLGVVAVPYGLQAWTDGAWWAWATAPGLCALFVWLTKLADPGDDGWGGPSEHLYRDGGFGDGGA